VCKKKLRVLTRSIDSRAKIKKKSNSKIERSYVKASAEDVQHYHTAKNRLRSVDITYRGSRQGGFYLVVIIDLYSYGVLDGYTVCHMSNQL
jgi:hypothetical protein